MKYLIPIIFTGLLCFGACNKTEDEPELIPQSGIHGKWDIISVLCFCPPADIIKGEQIWTIDTIIEKVIVENNVTDPWSEVFPGGEYMLNINYDSFTLKLDGYGVNFDYYIKDQKLHLEDDPASDGIKIVFERSN